MQIKGLYYFANHGLSGDLHIVFQSNNHYTRRVITGQPGTGRKLLSLHRPVQTGSEQFCPKNGLAHRRQQGFCVGYLCEYGNGAVLFDCGQQRGAVFPETKDTGIIRIAVVSAPVCRILRNPQQDVAERPGYAGVGVLFCFQQVCPFSKAMVIQSMAEDTAGQLLRYVQITGIDLIPAGQQLVGKHRGEIID